MFLVLAAKSRRRVHFALYVFASIFMMYSHAYGLFILLAQNLYALLRIKTYRSLIPTWITCQILILLGIIPYFWPLFTAPGGASGSIEHNIGGHAFPDIAAPVRSIYRHLFSPRRDTGWEVILALYTVAALFLFAGTWLHLRRGKQNGLVAAKASTVEELRAIPDVRGKLLLLACWLLCPVLLPFFLTFVVGPMYADHYTISAAPALYLLLSFALFSIRRIVPLAATLGALLIVIVPGLVDYYAADVHEQWRKAAAYVAENGKPGDVVVFAPNQGTGIQETTFDWYYRGALPQCEIRSAVRPERQIYEALAQCVTGYNRVWILMRDHRANVERLKSLFQDPARTSFHVVDRQEFAGISVFLAERNP
jgi:hypothetical protein